MLILPTMGRPHNLRRFVDTYHATGGTLPVHIVLDAADAENYRDITLPAHFVRHAMPAGSRLGNIFKTMFESHPNDEFYGMVADDVVPETHGWDVILRDACLPGNIAWGFDGLQNENLPTHPFIGGELLRRLGWWAAPGLKHWCIDSVWKILADMLRVGVYLPEVRMMHHHPVNHKAPNDATYANQPDHAADKKTCLDFLHRDLPEVLRRAKVA